MRLFGFTAIRAVRPAVATVGTLLALAAPASAFEWGRWPVGTFEANGVTLSPFGSSSNWCTVDESGMVGCAVADLMPPPEGWLGSPIGEVSYPFNATMSVAAVPGLTLPESLDARLSDVERRAVEAPVTVAKLDADSWSISVPGPLSQAVQLSIGARFPRPPAGQIGSYGYWGGSVRLEPRAAPVIPPVVVPEPPVQPSAIAAPSPTVTLVGVARRGSRLVVRVRTNVAGTLSGGVRQARRASRFSKTGQAAGTHRLVLTVPRPRTRAATVTLKLTDAAGRTGRVARTTR